MPTNPIVDDDLALIQDVSSNDLDVQVKANQQNIPHRDLQTPMVPIGDDRDCNDPRIAVDIDRDLQTPMLPIGDDGLALSEDMDLQTDVNSNDPRIAVDIDRDLQTPMVPTGDDVLALSEDVNLQTNIRMISIGYNGVLSIKSDCLEEDKHSKCYNGTFLDRRVMVKCFNDTHRDIGRCKYKLLKEVDKYENIHRTFGYIESNDSYYLLMEPFDCSLKTLSDQQELNTSFIEKTASYPTTKMKKLLRDLANGVCQLHKLNMAHLNITPGTALIVKLHNEVELSVKLTDMGVGKRLQNDNSKVESKRKGRKRGVKKSEKGATSEESYTWKSPEQLDEGLIDQLPKQLEEGLIDKKTDIFSLGCVIYHTLTKGEYPFGVKNVYGEKTLYIRANNSPLLKPLDNNHEGIDLISKMLRPEPLRRPTISEVLNHPLFWSPTKRLMFLKDASDWRLNNSLEDEAENVYKSKMWFGTYPSPVDEKFVDHMEYCGGNEKKTSYNGQSLRHLLRFVRNTYAHYHGIDVKFQGDLQGGSQREAHGVDGGIEKYFRQRFPYLLMAVYYHCEAANDVRKTQWFRSYSKGG